MINKNTEIKIQKLKTSIDFANLQKHYQFYKDEIDAAIHSVLDKSNYIMGEEVIQLENSLQEFTGAKHAITRSSGTDVVYIINFLMTYRFSKGSNIV